MFYALDFSVPGGLSSLPGADSFYSFSPSDLTAFDQDPFFGGDAFAANMGHTGFVFVPPSCVESTCRLHVHFHGCGMHYDEVGYDFMLRSGFLEVAAANELVLLFPQVVPTSFSQNKK